MKVSKAAGSEDASWMVNDQRGWIALYVQPAETSALVRREMEGRRYGYFYAVRDGDGRIIWGTPAGEQAW